MAQKIVKSCKILHARYVACYGRLTNVYNLAALYSTSLTVEVDVRNKKWRENVIRQCEMDSPGGSLFLGGPSIHIDDTAQRLQEQEEQEDWQRREVEVCLLFVFFLFITLALF